MVIKRYSRLERRRFIEQSLLYIQRSPGLRLRMAMRRLASPLLVAQTFTKGVDVSHWQGQINWTALYAAGYRWAYIKATEGASFVDSRFEENWRAALDAGFVIGAYHFARANIPFQQQVDLFLQTVQAMREATGDKTLPPLLDCESQDGVTNGARRSCYNGWLSGVSTAYKKAAIYSAAWFWNMYVAPTAFANQYHLFGAHWTPNNTPVFPAEWNPQNIIMWQHCVCPDYSWCSPCDHGLPGSWDLDRFFGTEADLRALAGFTNEECDCDEILGRLSDLEEIAGMHNEAITQLLDVQTQLLNSVSDLMVVQGQLLEVDNELRQGIQDNADELGSLQQLVLQMQTAQEELATDFWQHRHPAIFEINPPQEE